MKWIDRMAVLLAAVAGYMLFGVMLFIVVSIIFRYVLGDPIFGSQDVMEMVLIGVTLFGLAYTEKTDGHISVDLFDGVLGRGGRLFGDILARLLGISLVLLMTWGAWEKMLDAWEWGDATNLLGIPFWPFYGLIMISALSYVIVMLTGLARLLSGSGRREA